MSRWFLVLCSVNGFASVALGAFGAHGLKGHLAAFPDAAKHLEWWETAARFQLAHALALGLAAWVASRGDDNWANVAGIGFQLGILLFSGSLYLMALTGSRMLGVITPVGGLGLLIGWVALGVAAYRAP